MVFGLFGVCWVMPMSVVELLACWQGQFGRYRNGYVWIVVPHCLMWCIWKERNSRCFEDSDCSMPDPNPFLQFWIYVVYVIFEFDMFAPLYSLCT